MTDNNIFEGKKRYQIFNWFNRVIGLRNFGPFNFYKFFIRYKVCATKIGILDKCNLKCAKLKSLFNLVIGRKVLFFSQIDSENLLSLLKSLAAMNCLKLKLTDFINLPRYCNLILKVNRLLMGWEFSWTLKKSHVYIFDCCVCCHSIGKWVSTNYFEICVR